MNRKSSALALSSTLLLSAREPGREVVAAKRWFTIFCVCRFRDDTILCGRNMYQSSMYVVINEV